MKRLAILAVPLAASGSNDRQAAPRAQTSPKPPAVHHVGDPLTTRGTTGPVKLTVTGTAYPDKPQAYKAYPVDRTTAPSSSSRTERRH